MGEDESGDLKTPLRQRYFIKIIQLAFRNSTFERTFEGKHETFYYWTLCKKESDLLFIQTFSFPFSQSSKKKFQEKFQVKKKHSHFYKF